MKCIIDEIPYNLTYKKVKNINMRVLKNGEIHISAPKGVKKERIERFIISKKTWIKKALNKVSKATSITPPSNEECLDIFLPICDKIYSIFEKHLENKPKIIVKDLKSSWGICHYTKNYIVLNSFLANKPATAIEYVVLHEFVHFFEHNHQKGFYDIISSIMPDYKERRKLLKAEEF